MKELLMLESTWYVTAAAGVLLGLLVWRLSKVVPWQNVALILVVTMAVEVGLDYLLLKFGKLAVDVPAWHYYLSVALLWPMVVLGSRRLSKLILRPWRKEKVYGYWLIGMSTVATYGFAYGWLAVCPTPIPGNTAALMALFRAITTAVLVVGLSPWFARKRLSSSSRSELSE